MFESQAYVEQLRDRVDRKPSLLGPSSRGVDQEFVDFFTQIAASSRAIGEASANPEIANVILANVVDFARAISRLETQDSQWPAITADDDLRKVADLLIAERVETFTALNEVRPLNAHEVTAISALLSVGRVRAITETEGLRVLDPDQVVAALLEDPIGSHKNLSQMVGQAAALENYSPTVSKSDGASSASLDASVAPYLTQLVQYLSARDMRAFRSGRTPTGPFLLDVVAEAHRQVGRIRDELRDPILCHAAYKRLELDGESAQPLRVLLNNQRLGKLLDARIGDRAATIVTTLTVVIRDDPNSGLDPMPSASQLATEVVTDRLRLLALLSTIKVTSATDIRKMPSTLLYESLSQLLNSADLPEFTPNDRFEIAMNFPMQTLDHAVRIRDREAVLRAAFAKHGVGDRMLRAAVVETPNKDAARIRGALLDLQSFREVGKFPGLDDSRILWVCFQKPENPEKQLIPEHERHLAGRDEARRRRRDHVRNTSAVIYVVDDLPRSYNTK